MSLSDWSSIRRVRRCGRVSVIAGGEVHLREGGASGAGYAGLETCGSCWACPVCSAKIAARKATELEHVLRWNADRGGTVALSSFTIRHHRGHTLADEWAAFQKAWRRMTAHRTWREAREGLFDHYVRAVECTCGDENGWHLHAHVLLLFPEYSTEPVPVSCPDCDDFAADPWWSECQTCHGDGVVETDPIEHLTDELFEVWSKGLPADMRPSRAHGVDIRVGHGAVEERLSKYLSKLTFEAAGGRFKQGRKGSRTPFELLDAAISDAAAAGLNGPVEGTVAQAQAVVAALGEDGPSGIPHAVELWLEWERASHRKKQLVWSRGLRAAAGLDSEKTDEEIVAEEDTGQTVAILPARTWRAVYPVALQLRRVLAEHGREAAYQWLDCRGLAYEPVEPTVRPPPLAA
ncbi:MAG: protein rep [Actinomycetota bacterium]|nr:protein rep [Actinomycetota bacterium]